MEDKVKKIFCQVLGVQESEVNDETAYDSFEPWDSLRHMRIVAALEKEFDINFIMDDIIAMGTFKKIKDTVKKYIEMSGR